jgi:hypothetical protein
VTEPELPSPAGPPAAISHLVRQRTEARARRDWASADALKSQIEAAGWRVVDHGNRTSVSPAALPTVEVGGEMRYGSAAAVPSLLDQPATAILTVAIVASEAPERVSRLLAALRDHAPQGTQVVVVANDPSLAQEAALQPDAADRAPIGGRVPEVLRTTARLGLGAALNMALRRAAGEIVLLADGTVWPAGEALTPLIETLSNPAVAAVGAFGLIDRGPGPFQPNALERATGNDGPEVTALEAGWLAFRRADYAALGPLDERFVTPAWLDVWWSLRLRCGAEPDGVESNGVENVEAGEDSEDGAPAEPPARAFSQADLPAPRRAVKLDLPVEREAPAWPPDRSRLNRRNMYRVLHRFGWREDLAGQGGQGSPSKKGSGQDQGLNSVGGPF